MQQEVYFNHKANIALESIVNDISDNYDICNTVSECLSCDTSSTCNNTFNSKEEWNKIDSIIKTKLKLSNIELNYNFDFCSRNSSKLNIANIYTKNMNNKLAKSGIVMYLELPTKSKFIFRQMGTVFISSLLIILLISIVFIIIFRFYRKEKNNAERTRDFLNNMTHEFKTPLANIAFANNLLRRNLNELSTERILKYTQIIQTENQNIIESSEDILEMAKHEYDFSKIPLESVCIHDIIYDLQKSFQITFNDLNIDISVNLNATLFSVNGKTSILRNAFSNIIDNAIKYCENVPVINISTKNEKQYIIISIEDNGIGIAKEETASIFDKFYRISTGDRHDVKGFGLGLTYVKVIIQNLKGSIFVKSNLKKGSVFTIKLPIIND